MQAHGALSAHCRNFPPPWRDPKSHTHDSMAQTIYEPSEDLSLPSKPRASVFLFVPWSPLEEVGTLSPVNSAPRSPCTEASPSIPPEDLQVSSCSVQEALCNGDNHHGLALPLQPSLSPYTHPTAWASALLLRPSFLTYPSSAKAPAVASTNLQPVMKPRKPGQPSQSSTLTSCPSFRASTSHTQADCTPPLEEWPLTTCISLRTPRTAAVPGRHMTGLTGSHVGTGGHIGTSSNERTGGPFWNGSIPKQASRSHH